MLNLTAIFSDNTQETANVNWFTVTYQEDLQAPTGSDDCPVEFLGRIATAKQPATITSVRVVFTPEDDKKAYFHLWHGRQSTEEQLEHWGFNGPYLGPLKEALFTQQVSNTPASWTLHLEDGQTITVPYQDDLGLWQNEFYGDLTVAELTPDEAAKTNARAANEFTQRHKGNLTS